MDDLRKRVNAAWAPFRELVPESRVRVELGVGLEFIQLRLPVGDGTTRWYNIMEAHDEVLPRLRHEDEVRKLTSRAEPRLGEPIPVDRLTEEMRTILLLSSKEFKQRFPSGTDSVRSYLGLRPSEVPVANPGGGVVPPVVQAPPAASAAYDPDREIRELRQQVAAMSRSWVNQPPPPRFNWADEAASGSITPGRIPEAVNLGSRGHNDQQPPQVAEIHLNMDQGPPSFETGDDTRFMRGQPPVDGGVFRPPQPDPLVPPPTTAGPKVPKPTTQV